MAGIGRSKEKECARALGVKQAVINIEFGENRGYSPRQHANPPAEEISRIQVNQDACSRANQAQKETCKIVARAENNRDTSHDKRPEWSAIYRRVVWVQAETVLF